MLVISVPQFAVLEREFTLQFEQMLIRKARAELVVHSRNGFISPEKIVRETRDLARAAGITAPGDVTRLVVIISRYFPKIGGQPPLPKPALRILLRKSRDVRAKLDEMEALGASR